jgi:hypothetical protein
MLQATSDCLCRYARLLILTKLFIDYPGLKGDAHGNNHTAASGALRRSEQETPHQFCTLSIHLAAFDLFRTLRRVPIL